MLAAAEELSPRVGTARACRVLEVPRSTLYRRRRATGTPVEPRVRPRKPSPRRLSDAERAEALEVLHSERFVDRAPAQVVSTLLDGGRYICSTRTMYRLLAAHDEVRERRDQRRHPKTPAPSLIAHGPNQVWSWDITQLPTVIRGWYLFLYVILDIFSRYVVGWTIAESESARIARRLIEQSVERQGIVAGQLTLHQDRGGPMVAKTLRDLLLDLDITRSFSRPRTSDDNPFSESHFKTMKYHPETPKRFEDLADALAWARKLFPWYNHEHRHSGIAWLTPATVHYGRSDEQLARRHQVLLGAYQCHPERFVHGPPKLARVPEAVGINHPATKQQGLWEEPDRKISATAVEQVPKGLIVASASAHLLTNFYDEVSQSY